ncbi:anti-phage defense-associated sirtuin Dsr1 [Pseudomonas sp. 22447]|uniref:anti-phage defense-associated sirtuin Dsr1 n=1 Tax=Pseudomonas sp. 22447 TaxID=3453919 RepID=UPI003F86B609
MQFVADGPDVPDELLQAHEEGRVVIFCGAGISYPAGLPGFQGLVDKIYNNAGTFPNKIEEQAYKREQYDAVLDLLEQRITGQHKTLRSALFKALKPNLRRKGATDTHAALLHLARTRSGTLRLVTTNFDRIFEAAAKRNRLKYVPHIAPMLPIPKTSRWDGLVFLHGLLPKKEEEHALNRLVVTSGDFGLAYLTERWAARFVGELFRNFIVCFIGYSINDPVLRYMMDALAADRRLGEVTPKAWAFGESEPGQEALKTIEWEAKGVTPILYKVLPGSYDHSRLHATLRKWSETYSEGTTGKERMVSSNALARPSASTKEDDFVGRMLWALSDKSGIPAKRFAEFNPAPALEWLTAAFSEPRFKHSDLNRFGVTAQQEVDPKLLFNLVARPTPYALAPHMRLVCAGLESTRWDKVMLQLSRWLLRHLNDPELILWVVNQGGHLHDEFRSMIDYRLSELATLQRSGSSSELKEIQAHSPNALPSRETEILWRLLLSGRVKSPWRDLDLYRWEERLKQDGMTLLLKLELRELLTPKVALKPQFRWREKASDADTPKTIRNIVNWELTLAADNVRSTLKEVFDRDLEEFLPGLIDDFEHLLLEALNLLSVLGGATDRSDRSHWDLPSILDHDQNRRSRDWVALIELLRDAWLAIREKDPVRATRIAVRWFDIPYPTFKRLALFAASQNDCITHNLWVPWLTADEGWWLWAGDVRREMLRLLVLQGRHLSGVFASQLQRAILKGPPREIFKEDVDPERLQQHTDRMIWLTLAKLDSSGFQLNATSTKRLAKLSNAHPLWRLADNQSDEFSRWMSGSGDADFENSIVVTIAPTKRAQLVDWLKEPPKNPYGLSRDDWGDTCRRHPLNSLYALDDLVRQDIMPVERWREFFRVWSNKASNIRFWTHAAPIIQALPDRALAELAHSVSSWLEAVSDHAITNENLLFTLCRRLMAIPQEPDVVVQDDDFIPRPVTDAINHPIGMVTQALANRWFKQPLHDNGKLSAPFADLFTTLADTSVRHYRHARVILGSHLIALFRVDSEWTTRQLLPLLNWDLDPVEAKGVWEGFLWSPRLYAPLLEAFKTEFLQTTRHYDELGEHSQQFAGFFTYAAIDPIESYSVDELRTALHALPTEGLDEAAQALSQALEGAADQREEYWENRILPFWKEIWPKDRDRKTVRISESLARLTLAAGERFPSAVDAVADWLCPVEHPYFIVSTLKKSTFCKRFPAAALKLLSLIIDDNRWVIKELRECLKSMSDSEPGLINDPRYQRLQDQSRQ